jgi:hypothetical protein
LEAIAPMRFEVFSFLALGMLKCPFADQEIAELIQTFLITLRQAFYKEAGWLARQ